MTGVKLYYCGEGTGAMYETDCREDLGYGLYVSYADYAALQAALLAKSAAYEALVAGCSELAAKLDRQAAENYTDRGNALSRCADDIRLLVSDDRPSHTERSDAT